MQIHDINYQGVIARRDFSLADRQQIAAFIYVRVPLYS